MRNLICVLLVVLVPLTLASDTQHRFKVYVYIGGKEGDDQAVRTIETHLKRELRLLGDVDVVGRDDNWQYSIEFFVMALERNDGTKIGDFAIATYHANRLPGFVYEDSADYKTRQATWNGTLGAAFYLRESLPKLCIEYVGTFDKNKLESIRYLFR